MLQFMRVNTKTAFILICSFIFLFSCNDPSDVGSELLDQDGIDVIFVDTVSMNVKTVKGVDSIRTNGFGRVSQDLYLGEIRDDYFGFKKFDSYFQVSIASVPPSFYNYDSNSYATVDSIVLLMNMTSGLFYGDTSAQHNIQVFEIDQDLDDNEELYTTDPISAMIPISDVQEVRPSLQNFDVIFDGDTTTTAPSIRVRLYNTLAERIINDTVAVKRDSSFRAFFKGIKVQSETESTSVLPLDARVKTLTDIGNKIILYYTDTVPKFYPFVLGGVRHVNVTSEISGTDFENALDNEVLGDSLLYLQGFGCGDAMIEFPHANFENFGNILVKKAELEITVASLEGNDEELSPIKLLFLFEKDDDDERVLIQDIFAGQSTNLLSTIFGGSLQEELDGNGVVVRRFYTMNITQYFQDLIKENSGEVNKLYLGAAVPELSPERSILCGPGHSQYPMKLNLTYSLPN